MNSSEERSINIDVIIPIYNCQDYIDRCLKSLLKQKRQDNLKIILVDDGSTDKSGYLVDKYANAYLNITAIHKKNGGLSSARNAGLKIVNGDYFTFIDPDDWVEENYIEKVIKELKSNIVDILMVPYIRKYEKVALKNNFLGNKSVLYDRNETRGIILNRLFGLTNEQLGNPLAIDNISTAWGKFYRTSKFSVIEFSDKKEIYAEDLYFNIKCFLKAKSSEYFAGTHYVYFKENKASIVHTYDDQMLSEYKELYRRMWRLIDKNNLGKSFNQALNNRIIINELTILRNISMSGENCFNKIKAVNSILNDSLYINNYKNFKLNMLPMPYRIFYTCCKYKMSVFILTLLDIGEKLKTTIKQ